MTPTIDFLKANFDKYNKLYFNGDLITPSFELFKSKRVWGQFSWGCGYKIRISTYYDRDEKNILNTLIHEMIHQYIKQNNIIDTRPHHGKVFHSIAARINKDGWNIKTCSSDNSCSFNSNGNVTYYLAAFYLKDEDKYFIIRISKDKISYFKRQFSFNKLHFTDVLFFTSKDSKFDRYNTCRSRIRGYYITKEEFENYKETADIFCEGDDIYTLKY